MSKAAKTLTAATPDISFEEALKQLESIVEAMESGELPLEAMLTRFEDGTRLARLCRTRLEEASQKISQLEKNAGGEFVLKPSGEAEETDADTTV